jgi:transposase
LDTAKASKERCQAILGKSRTLERGGLGKSKKKAVEGDYEIYFQDESTLQLCNNIVKTYSPRGETPILELRDTKGYQYVCIASAISEAGKMFYQIRDNSFKGTGIIGFLKDLLAFASRKVLLIWDNASWHKSEEVKDFLNTDLGKMLWVSNTPPYSPEFNPDELVWANLKRVQIPNRLAKNVKELKDIAHEGMIKIQNSIELVKSFFNSENFHFTNS